MQAEQIDEQEFEVEEDLDLAEADDDIEGDEVESEEDDAEESDVESEYDEDQEESDTDEIVVSIEGEAPPPADEENKAPEWVRDLRKSHRDMQKENRDLKARLDELSGTGEKPVELGKKPTLEDSDYDTDAYERSLADWYEAKREHDKAEAEAAESQKAATQEWQNTLDAYSKKKADLKVRDYDDAESFVQDNFSTTQQGMIIQGADNPAVVVYALGKNPKKAKELSEIKDPVKFAFAVAKLETKMKVDTRKATTKPEKTVSGNARKSGAVDSNLERLRAEAEKTGDYTKVSQYKRNKRSAK